MSTPAVSDEVPIYAVVDKKEKRKKRMEGKQISELYLSTPSCIFSAGDATDSPSGETMIADGTCGLDSHEQSTDFLTTEMLLDCNAASEDTDVASSADNSLYNVIDLNSVTGKPSRNGQSLSECRTVSPAVGFNLHPLNGSEKADLRLNQRHYEEVALVSNSLSSEPTYSVLVRDESKCADAEPSVTEGTKSSPSHAVAKSKQSCPCNVKTLLPSLLLFAFVVFVGVACVCYISTIQKSQEYSIQELTEDILMLKDNISILNEHYQNALNMSHANMKIFELQNQQLLDTLENFGQSCNLAASCAGLLASSPSTPSGHYWVKSNNGSAVRVYCDMTRSCGGVTGGWTRVAELDTNNTTQCPGDLRYLDKNSVTVCGIRITSFPPAFSSATFNLSGILYSRMCGRIKAYQFGTPEAFHPTKDIDSVYVDGISLTHGNPRQHIWTFAADSNTNSTNCPCSPSHQTTPTPSLDFVGEDYFCNTASDDSSRTYHFDNPLWDGDGCIPGNMCCSFNSPPWFYKQLPRPTTDDIEMRVCADKGRGDEDIGIESLEIYVQ